MKKERKRGNGFFYFFWFVMLLFASVLTIAVLSRIFPDFIPMKKVLESIFGPRVFSSRPANDSAATDAFSVSDSSESRTIIVKSDAADASAQDFAADQSALSDSAASQDTFQSNSQSNAQWVDANNKNAPLPASMTAEQARAAAAQNAQNQNSAPPVQRRAAFNGEISSGWEFLSRDGRQFSAGIIAFTRSFPGGFTDFPTNYFGAPVSVDVRVRVGWNDLPSFARLDEAASMRRNGELSPTVSVPPLQALSVEVDVPPAVGSDAALLRAEINAYIQKMFSEARIASSIVSDAQRRLGAAYISRGYTNVVMVSR